MQTINYGSKRIEYNLSFATRKSLGIKVSPNGDVNVLAPVNTALIDISKKVKSKANWILKQQSFFNSYKPHTPTRKFVSGETHLYLGRQYLLEIMKDEEQSSVTNYELRYKKGSKNIIRNAKFVIEKVKIYCGKMIVYTNNSAPQNIEKIITKFYKKQAEIVFTEIFNNCLKLHKQFVIHNSQFVIRNFKMRWGSCTKAGKIILNTALIKAPKASIEYVIIHELCHLIHYNHNKDFYALQNKLYPNWEKWKEKLELLLV